MGISFRQWVLAFFSAVAIPACGSGADDKHPELVPSRNSANEASSRTLAQFTGRFDPATGRLAIESVTADETQQAAQALTSLTVDTGSTPGSAPANTVQLGVMNTRSGASGCGRADTVCSDVQVQSFYGVPVPNVYAEIVSMVPSTGNESYNSIAPAFGLSNVLGLWSYGSLATAGASGDRATQTWGFNALSGSGFTFQGRVVGNLAFTNYTVAPTTGTFVDACAVPGATTGLLPSVDDSTMTITLPFPFTFYDRTGTAAWISSNGLLGLGSSPTATWTNGCAPSTSLPVGVVMPFFDDLVTRGTGLCTATIGSYPSRQFVVTWSDARFYGDGGSSHLSFSVVLSESDGSIDLEYGSLTSTNSSFAQAITGGSATVGLWSPAGTAGAEAECNQSGLLTAPMSLHFTPHECPTGQHLCGGACVSDTSTSNCGAACTPCTPPGGGTASCDGYLCSVTCPTGYHTCGGSCGSDTSPATCGTACTPCPSVPNSSSTCTSGVCGFTCNSGFHLCSGGCSSNTSPLGCGSSCTPCPSAPNANATCDGTSCGFACIAGWADCNGTTSDGCEQNVATDPLNCGSCGAVCSTANVASATCTNGICTGACAAGFADCNGSELADGCEVSISSDVANCGGCGQACAGTNVVGSSCTGGACAGTCASNSVDCDANLRDGCECTGTACCGTGCQTAHSSALVARWYDCQSAGTTTVNAQSACGSYSAACSSTVLTGATNQWNAWCGVAATGTYSGQCACWVYGSPTGGTARLGYVYLAPNASCSVSGPASGTFN